MAVHGCDQSCTEANNCKELSPINILSVDFDWIMAPSIVAYNEFAHGGGSNDWEVIQSLMPGVSFKADMDKYLQLVVYLTNICDKLKDRNCFLTANSHDDIVHCMTKEWKIGNKPYNIYNIDHHHDCGYGNDFNLAELNKQELSCANWAVKLLNECPNYQSYTWIKNNNSSMSIPDDILEIMPYHVFSSDINVINYVNFDYVFMCSSPGWTPPNYLPLFDALRFSLEKLVNK